MSGGQCTFAAKDWSRAPVRMEKLCDLTLDLNLYPRGQVDKDVVAGYARALEAGAEFPAIKVGLLGQEKVIVDGAHRIGSRKLLKIDYVDCKVLPFSSAAELFAEAVCCNAEHGKAFNDADIKSNIKRLQQFKFQVKDIQVLLHVPAREINKSFAAPIATVRTPWGEKRPIHQPESERPFTSPTPNVPNCDIVDLIKFKNSLQFCISYAESRREPFDELVIKQLVPRCQAALGRLKFS